MGRFLVNYLALFTSMGTLVCCALPSFLVLLGAGSVMASLFANVPGMIWVSANKDLVFIVAGILLIAGGYLQYRARFLPCPADPAQAEACNRSRKVSKIIYIVAVVLYLIGGFTSYILVELLY